RRSIRSWWWHSPSSPSRRSRGCRSTSPTSTWRCRRASRATSTGSTDSSTSVSSRRTEVLRLVGRRLLAAAPGLAGGVVVTFVLMRALPGDPAAFFAGPAATKQAIEEIRKSLGLDRSLPVQFVAYVSDLARGDLGKSITTGQPVRSDLITRLPASLELTACGL